MNALLCRPAAGDATERPRRSRQGGASFGPADAAWHEALAPRLYGFPRIGARPGRGEYRAPAMPPGVERDCFDLFFYSLLERGFEETRASHDQYELCVAAVALTNERVRPWHALASQVGFESCWVEYLEASGTEYTILKTLLVRVAACLLFANRLTLAGAFAHARSFEALANSHLELAAFMKRFRFYADALLLFRAARPGAPGLADALWPEHSRRAGELRTRDRLTLVERNFLRAFDVARGDSAYDIYYPIWCRGPAGENLPDLSVAFFPWLCGPSRPTPGWPHLQVMFAKLQRTKCARRSFATKPILAATGSPDVQLLLQRIIACSQLGMLGPAARRADFRQRIDIVDMLWMAPMPWAAFVAYVTRMETPIFYSMREYSMFCAARCSPGEYALVQLIDPKVAALQARIYEIVRDRHIEAVTHAEMREYVLTNARNLPHGARPPVQRAHPADFELLKRNGLPVHHPVHFRSQAIVHMPSRRVERSYKRGLRSTQERHDRQSFALRVQRTPFENYANREIVTQVVALHNKLLSAAGRAQFVPGGETRLDTLAASFRDAFRQFYTDEPTSAQSALIYVMRAEGRELLPTIDYIAKAADLSCKLTRPPNGALQAITTVSLQVAARMMRLPQMVAAVFELLYQLDDPKLKKAEIKRLAHHIACPARSKFQQNDGKRPAFKALARLRLADLPPAEVALDFARVTALLQELSGRTRYSATSLPHSVAMRQYHALRRRARTPPGEPLEMTLGTTLTCGSCPAPFRTRAYTETRQEDLFQNGQVGLALAKRRDGSVHEQNYVSFDSTLGYCVCRRRVQGSTAQDATLTNEEALRNMSQKQLMNAARLHPSTRLVSSALGKTKNLDPIVRCCLTRDPTTSWEAIEAIKRARLECDGERDVAGALAACRAQWEHAMRAIAKNEVYSQCMLVPLDSWCLLGRVVTSREHTRTICVYCGSQCCASPDHWSPLGPSCGCHVIALVRETRANITRRRRGGAIKRRPVSPFMQNMLQKLARKGLDLQHRGYLTPYAADVARRMRLTGTTPLRCYASGRARSATNLLVPLPVIRTSKRSARKKKEDVIYLSSDVAGWLGWRIKTARPTEEAVRAAVQAWRASQQKWMMDKSAWQ